MNVYAEFHREGHHEYRRMTLLQFGDSWDLIGSAVLKNPGSAKLEGQVTTVDLDRIKTFLSIEEVSPENWQRFRPDTTMRCLEKIFNSGYLGTERKLNGVIQLFNLAYIKEPNLELAHLKSNGNDSKLLFPNVEELVVHFKDKPVYIGWFDTWQKIQGAEPIARGIFDSIKNKSGNYLKHDFKENRFYHPIYINRSVRKEPIRSLIENFDRLLNI